MDPTRQQNPLGVYQDSITGFDEAAFSVDMQAHLTAMHVQAHSTILQPASNMITNQNMIFQPPMHPHVAFSPLKRESPHHSPMLQLPNQQIFDSVYLPPSDIPTYAVGSPAKVQHYATFYQPIAQKPQKALFTTFPTTRPMEREDLPHNAMYGDAILPQSDVLLSSASKPVLGKRSMTEAPPPRDRNVKRQKVEVEEPVVIPEPQDMPVLTDDGSKPPYSYAMLIGMAILRAPSRRLTLSQIYAWISETFTYYKGAEPGWMNSIRHNLSLNKAFVKRERPKDDPGKGNYWMIEEGMEKQFLKDKTVRRAPNPESVPSFSTEFNEILRPSTAPSMGPSTLPPKTGRNVDSSTFTGENEASSDATLPASDTVPQEEEAETVQMPPPPRLMRSSPVPPQFHSSPPVATQGPVLGTPPEVPRAALNVQPEGRKKRIESFKDSGFYSSIESSATRPQQPPLALSSEGDYERSVIKRGRAEEELARIRGSSYDPSPTKTKSTLRRPGSYLISSSPLRGLDVAGFQPLTPGARFKPSLHAPPTVSPTTHLRRHRETVRELVGTPAHGFSTHTPTHDITWTPAFTIRRDEHADLENTPDFGHHSTPGEGSVHELNINGFNGLPIWDPAMDASLFESFDTFFARGSPVKSTLKRPLLQRAATSTGVLAEVTGNRGNPSAKLLGSPFKMMPPKRDTGPLKSPLKRMTMPGTATLLNPATPQAHEAGPIPKLGGEDDAWAPYFVGDGDDGDGETLQGIDLAQGFRSIGTARGLGRENGEAGLEIARQQGKARGAMRPGFARSVTNLY